MALVSCDPDTSAPSYAYFTRGELQSVTYQAEGPRVAPPYPREALLVIEAQYLDMFGRGRKIPNQDILDLAWAAGECSMHFDQVQRVRPSTWKGQVSKEIHQVWVWDCLTDAEKACIGRMPKYKMVEILDAVGLGLWKLGRLR